MGDGVSFTEAQLRLLALSDKLTEADPIRTCPTKPTAKPENVRRRAYFRERKRMEAERKRHAPTP